MSKKQYVIAMEGKRRVPRDDKPADPLFMMDPEDIRYKEDYLCRKFTIIDHVVSYDSARGHCRTAGGVHYDVSRSHIAKPSATG